MARALLFAPKAALRGDIFEVRATIAHAMETGYRVDSAGATVPRDVIRRIECRDRIRSVDDRRAVVAVLRRSASVFTKLRRWGRNQGLRR